MLKIKNKKPLQEARQIKTRKGVLKAPVFMPVATRGAVKNLTPDELKALGAEIILGNTYHLWLKPGMEVIKKATLLRPASGTTARPGGLHKFMNWDGPILTDSGGFQVFSLAKHRKITEEGVEFSDPENGKKYFLTPEKSIEIQLALGSDIIMVLDECPAYPASRQEVEMAVRRTTEWAKRCKEYFEEKIHPTPPLKRRESQKNFSLFKGPLRHSFSEARRLGGIYRPLLFGIIQGGIYRDLRQRSAKEFLAVGFDGYAIGGVAVGEPRKYLAKVLSWVLPILPLDKPRYLMGLGKPEEIISAVLAGVDMFDCVIPTREARHGRIYVYSSRDPALSRKSRKGWGVEKFSLRHSSRQARTIKPDFYETLQITNSKFAKDMRPIDQDCSCYACQNYSRAYLNHLFKIKEGLGLRLATIHNLKFYLDLVARLKRR